MDQKYTASLSRALMCTQHRRLGFLEKVFQDLSKAWLLHAHMPPPETLMHLHCIILVFYVCAVCQLNSDLRCAVCFVLRI